MKSKLIISSALLVAICCLVGCDSKLGGDIDTKNETANTPNELTKQSMNQYIDPAQSVYK